MTRVPSDDPGRPGPTRLTERLAGTLRHHLLTAAQASLRALREVLAQFPIDNRRSARHATPDAPPPVAQADPRRTPSPHRGITVPPPPSAELLHDIAPLPDSYGSNRLVLLARDPHCLYAYWDFSPEHEQRVRDDAGSQTLRIVLRTYDATQIAFDAAPPTRFQDFAVTGGARSLYAYVGKPAACFVAEIGYLRTDGLFFPLARSQPVWTPRTEQPGSAPGRWMTVGWSEHRDGGEAARLGTAGPTVRELEGIERGTASRQAPSSWPGDLAPAAQRGSWSLVRGGRAPAVEA